MRAPLPALVLAIPLFAGGAAFGAEPSTNAEVERSIEQITEPPPYDWLRGPRLDARDGIEDLDDRPPRGEGRETRPARERPDSSESCDYEPQPRDDGKPDAPDRAPPEGEGCSSGPAPGGEVEPGGGAGGVESGGGGCGGDGSGPGCACDRGLGDCGCDRALGDCGCGDAVGAPTGCGGLGAAGAGVGYVLGAVALGLIVFLVVRAILRRDKSGPDEEIGEAVEMTSPEEMRVSEVAALPAVTMMDRAAQAAMIGDYRTAVGWAYLAGISSLHRAGFTDLHISTTNMAIISSTRRKGGPHEPTARLVRVFEELFFGGREPVLGHWEECRKIVEEELIDEPAH
jgi:hypothetical protein